MILHQQRQQHNDNIHDNNDITNDNNHNDNDNTNDNRNDNDNTDTPTAEMATTILRTAAASVCVLGIKLMFTPIYIQHDQTVVSVLIPRRDELCGRKLLRIQQGDLAMQCQSLRAHGKNQNFQASTPNYLQ